MDREIFAADVAPGSPTTRTEVKTLLCRLLQRIGMSVRFELLHEALRKHGLINYFELCSALAQLCETGHLVCEIADGIESYRVTELGAQTAEELADMLPAASMDKALAAARKLLARQKRLAEVRAEMHGERGGWRLFFALPDEDTNLISFSVFAPSEQEALKLRRRFLNDPVFLYKSVMSLLSGRRDVLGEPLPEGEELF